MQEQFSGNTTITNPSVKFFLKYLTCTKKMLDLIRFMKKCFINAKILHFGSLLAKAPLLEQGLRFMKKGIINAKILHTESLIAKPLLQQELPTCGPLIYFAQPVYTVFLTLYHHG
jgi:hypothetical protein